MKEFPLKLTPQNKDSFSDILYERTKCYLRRDLYEHIISQDENTYFSIDDFCKKVNNSKSVMNMVKELSVELENLGWKCKLSFGDTGLFIYSCENPPPSCW